MNGLLQHVRLGLALNFRNRMALIYGYLFPIIFLFSFWAIYRHDKVPLSLHLGELLTVTILGGACFGLPTALVSERERGVWRRYRATPVPAGSFVASTLMTRFLLLLTAALLQIALAMAIGMPPPTRPLELFVAFTFASIAFLGLGMLIAMLANSVPAVQALGQCIFLPMLMIGGIAVRLSSLPDWALHASAFFPGRYAVQALQDCVTGDGLKDARFELLALLLIGAAAGTAATQTFRWDKKPAPLKGKKRWLGAALGMWVLVGFLAELQGQVAVAPLAAEEEEGAGSLEDYLRSRPSPAPKTAPPKRRDAAPAAAPTAPTAEAAPAAPPGATEPSRIPASEAVPEPQGWREVTRDDIAQVAFERLPPDTGLVSPIARPGEEPDAMVAAQLDAVRSALPGWPPGRVEDVVQRTRNHLFVAAVPDVLQMEQLERFLPLLVYERLRQDIPQEDLIKALYWVAMHPQEGDDDAVRQFAALGLPEVSGPTRTARTRVMLYAFKLLGRLTGDIRPTN
jgi:hypothetical protein